MSSKAPGAASVIPLRPNIEDLLRCKVLRLLNLRFARCMAWSLFI
jgi:hypothetical protein